MAQTFIALLRGINVGGHKIIKMDRLRQIFEEMGFADVRTYIQSGNVAFSAESEESLLVEKIETALERALGYAVPTIVRSQEAISEINKQMPFPAAEAFAAGSKLYASLLSVAPTAARIAKITSYSNAQEQFVVVERTVFTLLAPNPTEKLRYSNNFIEKELKVTATTRNWETMKQLEVL